MPGLLTMGGPALFCSLMAENGNDIASGWSMKEVAVVTGIALAVTVFVLLLVAVVEGISSDSDKE